MKVAGERSFDAPRELVWRVLNEPAEMAELMPGVQSFDVADDDHWRANVKIPLGLGSLDLSIDFERTGVREPEFSSLRAKGNGVGALLKMDTSFRLAADGGGTHMAWEADVSIAGPVGAMGQRSRLSWRAAALDVVEEDLRGPEADDEAARARGLLHHAGVHRGLHRVAAVRRDDPPPDREALGLAGHERRHHGGRARLHPVLAPPRIGLGEPHGVETVAVERARRREHLVERLHGELHHADAEGRGHAFVEPVRAPGRGGRPGA